MVSRNVAGPARFRRQFAVAGLAIGFTFVASHCERIGAAEAATIGWNQFHGPNGSGVAADDAPAPVEFGPSQHVLWQADVPAGHSSPCIAGNRVFVTAFEADSKQ